MTRIYRVVRYTKMLPDKFVTMYKWRSYCFHTAVKSPGTTPRIRQTKVSGDPFPETPSIASSGGKKLPRQHESYQGALALFHREQSLSVKTPAGPAAERAPDAGI